ncbi:MAG: TIGR02677 family protein, partial [Polyangiaceae bacterium]|nr:TIGR02677 family protein [Polyangiaceae bacterium]
GLRAWFVPTAGSPSQAQLLRHFALDAIPALLRAIAHLHDRRVQRTDRREDFRALARWFAQSDDASAHRLARVAFGMAPARHLATNAETLEAWDEAGASGATPWASAPPMRIAPRMRQTGHYTKRGRKEKVIDRTAGKATLAALAAKEAEELERVRRSLSTSGRVRMSELERLDRASFGLFLDLLGAAYAGRARDDSKLEALSADGSLRIVLEPIADGGTARIETTIGSLVVPEAWVTIEDLARTYEAVAE